MAKKSGLLRVFHLPNWLVGVLAFIFVLRIPSFFEPFSYGDEMIYLSLGEAARKGLVFYRDIHDNKPPLLYLMAGLAGNVFWFRVILAGWMMGTTVLFWKLVKKLFPRERTIRQVAVVFFAIFTTIPLFEGQIANAELFTLGPIIGAFFLLLSKRLNYLKIFFSGILIAIATLFKAPVGFDVVAILFWWVVLLFKGERKLLETVKNAAVLIIGILVPILLSFGWYYARGAFNEYLISAFLQNVGYLSSWRPDDVVEPFLVRNGPLILRGGIMLFGLLILFLYRKKLSRPFMFSTAWLLVGLFGVTLSERPYPHYLIQIVPAAAMLVGILVAKQSIEQSLTVLPLALLVFVPIYFRFWYYPSFSYYMRFFRFASGQTNQEEYFDEFGGETNRNYEIADFITRATQPQEKIFVWGNSSAIYALSKRQAPIRYIANYHISDFSSEEEVMEKLTNDKPVFVVFLPGEAVFSELNEFVRGNYVLINTIEGASIWRRISPALVKLLR